jgi:hypothetical protein
MNRKQLVILLVLVVVLGGAAMLIRNKEAASSQSGNATIGQKLLGNFAVNDVAQIILKQGTNELNLAKKDELWRVRERNDYPANYSEISDFLMKLRDLKIIQSDKVGPSQLARYALVPGAASNSAMVVEFKDQAEKTLKSLLLGKKHMKKSDRPSPFGGDMGDEGWPDGRYVVVGNDSQNVALISDALVNIEPKPEQWLNKDFFKVEKVRSIAVALPVATNSWRLSRETESGEWKLADIKAGEQLDSAKASGVANPLASPAFVDVAAKAKPEEFGLDKPTVVTIGTFDDFNYTIKVGQKTNDNFPISMTVAAQLPKERAPGKDEKPEDKDKLDKEFKERQKKLEEKLSQEKGFENWIYLVSTWTVDPLLKERSHLLVEKKEEPKKDEAKKEDAKPGEPKKEEKPASANPSDKPDSKETNAPAPAAEAKPEAK